MAVHWERSWDRRLPVGLFQPLGAYALMLVAAALLGIYILIANIVNTREQRPAKASAKDEAAEVPLGKEGGFELVVGQRYLLLIALLMIALNLVNTTGEFILGKTVTIKAQQIATNEAPQVGVTAPTSDLANEERRKIAENFIGEFYATFFFWVSLISAAVQLFLVSRIIKYVGVSAALFFLPGVALGGYSIMIFMPVLSYIMVAKIAENSIDYSLQNTCRQALFLPTSREAKYKAKAAIDTFFVRIGDVLSALFVFTGVKLALDTDAFAAVNVGFALVSLFFVMGIARRYKKLMVESETPA
ncbi:MAG: hypothetical protein GEU77_17585 [Deltaproteobacteria bacterium]|nr:hypothetical protein [Deltaproteobacteria bacterium]